MEQKDVKRVLAGLSLATLLAGVAAGGCATPAKDGGTAGTGAKDAAPATQPATGGGMSGCGGGMSGCGGKKQ
jgi:radical SAM modification target selenobiotic family peptide